MVDTTTSIESESDIVWGAKYIGAIINRTTRQTHHLLTNAQIKCARKVGGRWVASRSALRREFGSAELNKALGDFINAPTARQMLDQEVR
jgi:hypothetical protein